METCKAQESVKHPLTALQTGEQRNKKSQCNEADIMFFNSFKRFLLFLKYSPIH